MLHRILVSSIAVLVAVVWMFAPLTAHAESPTPGNPNDEVSDLILAGTWQGIHFNFAPANVSPNSGGTTSAPTPTPTTSGAYIAMGDSVAAGVGLHTPSAAPSAEVRCERTQAAYPHQVAQALSLPLSHVACSGATTRDFYTRDWTPSPSLPAQLNAAFSGGVPGLITITSGANDVRWLGFLDNCYRRDCATTTSTVAFKSSLALLEGRLERTFKQIQQRSHGNPPTVIITGYYDPVSRACHGVVPSITAAEISWISDGVAQLNRTIQSAASKYSFVHFAPVNFNGHDVCSSSHWIQGLNNPRPFHPTAAGQRVMAQSVLSIFGR